MQQILFSIVNPNIQHKEFTEDRKYINKSQSLAKENRKNILLIQNIYTWMINCKNLFWAPTDVRERKKEEKNTLEEFNIHPPPSRYFTISGNYVSTRD